MKIFLKGDMHGSTIDLYAFQHELLQKEGHFNPKDITIIFLGDFGALFSLGVIDKKFKQNLEFLGFNYFVIRGNHERRASECYNDKTWHKEQMFDGEVLVENAYPSIKYATDYPSIYNIDGYKTLILPGAYSVDKADRLKWEKEDNRPYWFPTEQMTFEEMELAKKLCEENKEFDLILSHTCPLTFIPHNNFGWSNIDNTMEQFFYEIDHTVKCKSWVWGHHHIEKVYPWDDGIYCCLFHKFVDLHKFMDRDEETLSNISKGDFNEE